MGKQITKNPDIASNKGVSYVVREATPITKAITVSNNRLQSLIDIEQLTKQGNLLTLNGNFSTDSGDIHTTTDSAALLLKDNRGQPANLALFSLKNNTTPVIPYNTNKFAYVIGDLDKSGQWWAVDSEQQAQDLYFNLVTKLGLSVTILVSINKYQFKDMVEHFGKVNRVNVATTADKKEQLITDLGGLNADLWVTVLGVVTQLEQGLTLDEIKTDDDTTIIDLQAANWGEPEPLDNDPATPTRYPIEAFSGLLAKVVQAIAHYAQVPLATAGQCVLGALAHIGQSYIDAPMGHSHKPASLILITEMESGGGKTEAMGLSHYEIENYERQATERYEQELDEWKADIAGLTGKELKEYKESHPQPFNPEATFKDATIETILDKFINKEIINASWATDDAAQFFNGHTMTGKTAGNALTSITDLYSGGQVNRARSQKSAFANPLTRAYGVRFTLMLMAQNVILRPALSDPLLNGQGFLARALIACPEDMRGSRVWNDPKRWNSSPYTDPDLVAYWDRCKALLDPSPINDPKHNNDLKERIKMQWQDKQAEQTFYDKMQIIENRMRKGKQYEFTKAYASRMAENASRIAALMAYFDGRKTINTDDITRAFKLSEYSTAERLRYLSATPTNEQSDLQKLSEWLVMKSKDKNPPVLNRSMVTQYAPYSVRGKRLPFLLDDLESVEHIRAEKVNRKQLIFINPKLIDKYKRKKTC